METLALRAAIEPIDDWEELCDGMYMDAYGNIQDACHPENNVDPTFSQIMGILLPNVLGFFVTILVLKLLISAIAIKISHLLSWRSLLWLPLVSILGSPFLYFTFLFHDDHDFDFPILQIVSLLLIAAAALLEATAYYFINKKKTPFKKVFLLCAAINLAAALVLTLSL